MGATLDSSAELQRPAFSQREVDAVFGRTPSGLSELAPARCYYDPEIYRFEREKILKRNWIAVGRWDWAEKPGDYFTIKQFGVPLLVVRDKNGQLHCLVNVCRHRWAQMVDEGSGNRNLLVCPYHRWTYNLDGTLRGVSVEAIPNLNRANCDMKSIRLEVWRGIIFINFDADASALAPQLAGVEKYIERFNLEEMRSVSKSEYEASWNYKFSFETGYEAYHHAGVHKERIFDYAPPDSHEAIDFGEIWGIYGGRLPEKFDKPEYRHPLGRPPWMSDEEYNRNNSFRSMFIAIYPGFISYISPHQITMITTQHEDVDRNIAATHISISPWALERPYNEEKVAHLVQSMNDVQAEDTYACQILQKGVRSCFNDHSVIHPKYEPMLSHYHRWLLTQYQTA